MGKYKVSYLFLIISIILVLYTLIRLLIDYLKYKNNDNSKITGYDISKRVLDNNEIDNIDIIEARDGGSLYNVRRRVIKLSTKVYYGTSDYDRAIALHEVSHAVLDSRNNSYINFFKKIFTDLRFYSVSSYIVLIISYLLSGNGYNGISLLVFIIIFLYQYMVKCIENNSYSIAVNELERIDDIDKENIRNILANSNIRYNISLIVTILAIARVLVFVLLK